MSKKNCKDIERKPLFYSVYIGGQWVIISPAKKRVEYQSSPDDLFQEAVNGE